MNFTEEDIAKGKQWKELADNYNLSMFELYEVVRHFQEIQKLLSKNKI